MLTFLNNAAHDFYRISLSNGIVNTTQGFTCGEAAINILQYIRNKQSITIMTIIIRSGLAKNDKSKILSSLCHAQFK